MFDWGTLYWNGDLLIERYHSVQSAESEIRFIIQLGQLRWAKKYVNQRHRAHTQPVIAVIESCEWLRVESSEFWELWAFCNANAAAVPCSSVQSELTFKVKQRGQRGRCSLVSLIQLLLVESKKCLWQLACFHCASLNSAMIWVRIRYKNISKYCYVIERLLADASEWRLFHQCPTVIHCQAKCDTETVVTMRVNAL